MDKKLFSPLDVRIAVGVAICLLLGKLIPNLQTVTAAIAVILCVQDEKDASLKAGVTRVIITIVGGVVGLGVVLLDEWIGNEYVLILLAALGIVLTMVGCRLCKVPPFSARIGCITFVLVISVMPGLTRVTYALLRLGSTVVGAVVALGVSMGGRINSSSNPQSNS